MAAISALLLIASVIASFACASKTASLTMANAPRILWPIIHDRRAASERVRSYLHENATCSRFACKIRERKRTEELERAMPEALRLLCISLESGSSLVMALRYASENCAEPVASELKRTVWDLEAGQGFDEALEKLRDRTGGSEFAFLAVAMEIQHRSGGSLTSILHAVAELLKQTSQLKEDLRTKTAQGRLSSRIVAIMPFALLGLLSLFSPGYLTSFFSSPLGLCLFALALVFEIVGIILVRKSLAIDFSVDLEGAT